VNAGGHASLILKHEESSKREPRAIRREEAGNRPEPHRTPDSHAQNAEQGPRSLWLGTLGTCDLGVGGKAGTAGRQCGGGAMREYARGRGRLRYSGRPDERGTWET